MNCSRCWVTALAVAGDSVSRNLLQPAFLAAAQWRIELGRKESEIQLMLTMSRYIGGFASIYRGLERLTRHTEGVRNLRKTCTRRAIQKV